MTSSQAAEMWLKYTAMQNVVIADKAWRKICQNFTKISRKISYSWKIIETLGLKYRSRISWAHALQVGVIFMSWTQTLAEVIAVYELIQIFVRVAIVVTEAY